VEEDGVAGITEFSDALRVVRADVSREFVVQSHDTAGQQFTLSAHNLSNGDLAVVTDCRHVALFRATAAASPTLSHAANLGSGGVAYGFDSGDRVYRLHAATYFVDNNPAGQPSLFRERADGTNEELIEGVEDFQVTFGVDTDATPDGQANFPYRTSAEVESAAVPGATNGEKWARVQSVRVSLLMRTVEDNVIPSAQSISFNGAAVAVNDRRLRRVFTHVIKVRNR
jgi:type IV pilus assembly protein PilW